MIKKAILVLIILALVFLYFWGMVVHPIRSAECATDGAFDLWIDCTWENVHSTWAYWQSFNSGVIAFVAAIIAAFTTYSYGKQSLRAERLKADIELKKIEYEQAKLAQAESQRQRLLRMKIGLNARELTLFFVGFATIMLERDKKQVESYLDEYQLTLPSLTVLESDLIVVLQNESENTYKFIEDLLTNIKKIESRLRLLRLNEYSDLTLNNLSIFSIELCTKLMVLNANFIANGHNFSEEFYLTHLKENLKEFESELKENAKVAKYFEDYINK